MGREASTVGPPYPQIPHPRIPYPPIPTAIRSAVGGICACIGTVYVWFTKVTVNTHFIFR